MSVNIFLLYLVTWSLVALTPGPAVMCSVAQSTRYGFRSSLAGISGIQLGNLVFFVCIALGLGALLATATVAFSVLRVLGAIYLFYIGVRIIVFSFRRPATRASQPAVCITSQHSLFLQGLLIQVTNPKALLFVSALLPQFIEPHRSLLIQLVILSFTTVVVDTVVLSSYAFATRRGIQAFRSSRLAAWLERVLGAALILFGVRLLFLRK